MCCSLALVSQRRWSLVAEADEYAVLYSLGTVVGADDDGATYDIVAIDNDIGKDNVTVAGNSSESLQDCAKRSGNGEVEQ